MEIEAIKEVKTISSREVAEMMGVREHSKMIRKIEGISAVLNEAKIGLVDYFIESSYIDPKGEERKQYLVTRKGCEMLAHKSTGEKGIIFTAKYIERFAEMEQELDEIKEVVEEQGAISKEEFYEIHFKNNRRVHAYFQCSFNEYIERFTTYMEYCKGLKADERIKRLEFLQEVLEKEFNNKRQDTSIGMDELNTGYGVTKHIQLQIEQTINETKNRQYGAKLRHAKKH